MTLDPLQEHLTEVSSKQLVPLDIQGRLLRIRGRVQGVWYRATTQKKALELGLVGWCRNCPDGSVEAEAWGKEEQLEAFINWCYQGPPNAIVEVIDISVLTEPPVALDLTQVGVGCFGIRE